MSKYKYSVINLDCANCAKKIEDKLNQTDGFQNVIVNFNTSTIHLEAKSSNHKERLLKIIQQIEPDVYVEEKQLKQNFSLNKQNLILLIGGLIFGIASLFFKGTTSNILIIISFILLLPKILLKALKILVRNHSLDENMLITISVIGAYLIGDGFEGFMVIALYSIGKILEEMAVNKSRKNVSDLMDIRSDTANVLENEKIVVKDPKDVNIGDIIVVKVGEKIPLDGIIIDGKTHLNTSALTGESKPITKQIDDTVLSGSVNLTNKIEVKVTHVYQDSTVSQILNLVENATNRKAKAENFVSKAAKIYTPIIIGLSILTWLLLPLFGIENNVAIYRALSFLVISCPCAIAISVPLSYFSGIGISSKHGILIKGSDYLDNIRHIDTIVFDKTGTLTTGDFKVSDVVSYDKDIDKNDLLEISALGESFSNHPIATAILNAWGKDINQEKVSNYKEVAGKGISFIYQKKNYKLGNNLFVEYKDNNPNTCVYISEDNKVIGKIVLSDELKKDTKKAIRSLKKLGITPFMLTGDNKEIAASVAKECGIDEYHAELLPQDKYKIVEEKLKTKEKVLAFVGDGINDAPVLTLADIGISMGLLGSSSAIEASDVVIMTDELTKIVDSISISKYTSKIIKQTLIFSIGVKLLFIILNLFGLSTMALAVFADVGVTVLAILNSLRILNQKL